MTSKLDDYTVNLENFGPLELNPREWEPHRFELREPVLHRVMEPREELIILGVAVFVPHDQRDTVHGCYVNIVRSNRSVLGLYLPHGFFTPPFAIHCGGTEKVEFHRDPTPADVFVRGWRKVSS